jgi:hypothetical protein
VTTEGDFTEDCARILESSHVLPAVTLRAVVALQVVRVFVVCKVANDVKIFE